jgi:tripartite motif-containing protein 71
MMPHPTTMRFAWDENVLRYAGRIVAMFALVLIVLFGSALLTSGVQDVARAAPGENRTSLSAPGTRLATSPVEFVWQTEGGPGLLLDPINPAIDPQGNLWVPDGRNHRFQIFAPDGTFLETWGTPGSDEGQFDFQDPGISDGNGQASIAFDGEGNFYVVDTANRRIQKFGADRRFLTSWGRKGEGNGEFLTPIDIALDGHGRVYVGDGGRDVVQVFTTEGDFLTAWDADAYGGLALAPDGTLWMADWYANRLQHYSPEGKLLAAWDKSGTGEGEFINPSDVAVDEHGRVYVADFGNHRVQVFAADGRFLTAWGQFGGDAGEFYNPNSLVLDGRGNLYVAEESGNRVQKFRLLPPLGPK